MLEGYKSLTFAATKRREALGINLTKRLLRRVNALFASRQPRPRMHCRMYARSPACTKPLALASLRHAVRFATAGILLAKQPRRNLARSPPLRPSALACWRHASRAALTSSREGRRATAGALADGEATAGRGAGDGGAGTGAGAGGGDGDCAAGAGDAAAGGWSVAWAGAGISAARFASTIAASVTVAIPERFMTAASC